jgi:hypothetical protein
MGISETLALKYLIGCFQAEISELGIGAAGGVGCHVGEACVVIGVSACCCGAGV